MRQHQYCITSGKKHQGDTALQRLRTRQKSGGLLSRHDHKSDNSGMALRVGDLPQLRLQAQLLHRHWIREAHTSRTPIL